MKDNFITNKSFVSQMTEQIGAEEVTSNSRVPEKMQNEKNEAQSPSRAIQPKPEEGDQGQVKEDESVAQPEYKIELNQSKELAKNRPGPILGENGSALQTLNLDCNKLNDSQVTHVETTDRMMPLQDSIFGDTIDLPGPQAYAT